jgi:energy-dependent translational throttle protein EttA
VEEKRESRRQKELKRELEWSRMSPKARSTKNKARLQRLDELQAQQYDEQEGAADIQIPITRPLGDLVVKFENVSKAFGDRVLFENLEFSLPRGGIVGVIGPNGAGKTTLFKLIMGQEQPTNGSIRIGETVDLAYVDQSRDALEPGKTVYEEISGGHDTLEIGRAKIHARAYCGRFNFKGSDQQKFVGDLSGGERNRVHLAKLLRSGGNLILLDEPTNDLDVETLRSLEEGLNNFAGCAMVTSHDRWFLDRIATHILAFEGDSQVYWFEGNYKMYEIQRKERLGEHSNGPRRLQFKQITR